MHLLIVCTRAVQCYVVAQKSQATSPEGYGIDVAKHLLNEYSNLSA